MSKKNKKTISTRQRIINEEINISRENLIRGQLELEFLQQHLEYVKSVPSSEKDQDDFDNEETIKARLHGYQTQNRFFLSRMQFYKKLKQQNMDKNFEKRIEKHIIESAMQDYEKCPNTIVIDEPVK